MTRRTRLDLSDLRGPQPVEFITRRKGMEVVHNVLSAALRSGVIKPDGYIWTKQLERTLQRNGLAELWNRDPNRKDDNGFQKTLGDLLGGHGMRLRRKAPGCYIMPKVLPEIRGDCMIKEAAYD